MAPQPAPVPAVPHALSRPSRPRSTPLLFCCWLTIFWMALVGAALTAGQEPGREPRNWVPKDFAPSSDFYERAFGLVRFNGRTRTADWTLERLTAQSVSGDRGGMKFHSDPDVPREFAASPADYAGTGYDVGHQAPVRDHGQTEASIYETETIANACPQAPALNRGPWKQLEAWLFTYAHAHGVREVWVLTAPAWLPEDGRLRLATIGKNAVWVPTHCCKTALIVFNDGKLEMRAWKFENSAEPTPFGEAAISVDDFERATGLDAWPALPEPMQSDMEKRKP